MSDSVAAMPAYAEFPLVVDLDGTLIGSDMLYESLMRLLRANPLYILFLPLWLLRGRAHLKRQIARRAIVDVGSLPYRDDLLTYLQEQVRYGRKVILATTTDEIIANQIASHLGVFSTVVASDGIRNLKGATKAEELRALLGEGSFVYAGNDWSDVAVWRAAKAGIVVSTDQRLSEHVRNITPIETYFRPAQAGLLQFVRALRLSQWVKNLLVFVPLIAAHRVNEAPLLASAVLAFLAFSLVASAGYMINDLVDVETDRRHERKKLRPFASGALDFRVGFAAVPLLAVGGLAIGLVVSWAVALALLGYFLATQLYTFYLKRIALADAFALAVLYTARIVVGGLAVGVPISQWLLAFSVFFFLCLAFLKRYSELYGLRSEGVERAEGRGYLAGDFALLSSLGAASGFIAVLVLTLYINSPEVDVLYRTPEALWLVGLILLYWISRAWIIAHRGWMDEDPIVFALRDRTSYLAGGLCALAVVVAWA